MRKHVFCTLIDISRSLSYSTLNISETIQDRRLLHTTDRQWYAAYWIVPPPMTLSDLWRSFRLLRCSLTVSQNTCRPTTYTKSVTTSNYFYRRIRLEGLLCDAQRELLASAEFLIQTGHFPSQSFHCKTICWSRFSVPLHACRWLIKCHVYGFYTLHNTFFPNKSLIWVQCIGLVVEYRTRNWEVADSIQCSLVHRKHPWASC